MKEFKVLDVSNTIGKHRFRKEIKAEELIENMDYAGVDLAVIHSYAESEDNESVYNAFKKYPKRFIGLYTINPWKKDAVGKFIDAVDNKGFRGLYLNPIRHGYILSEKEVYYNLLEVCEKKGLPCWIYGGAEVFSSPVFFGDIANDFQKLNIIMGRMGLQYDNSSAVNLGKKFDNIYLETSTSMDFNTKRAIKTAGIEKVLLGTGTPNDNYFELEIKKVINATKEYKNGASKVLWENAAKLFGIN